MECESTERFPREEAKGVKQQHPERPTPDSWWQMQNRHLYFTSVGKASVSLLTYIRGIWFYPSSEEGRALSGAVALAPNLWVWSKQVTTTSSSSLLRQCLFISPHHIHPAGQVERWVPWRWECFEGMPWIWETCLFPWNKLSSFDPILFPCQLLKCQISPGN